MSNGDWVLIDASDILIHIFRPEVRDFYSLEKMWLKNEKDELIASNEK
jgi:ribosome-associated protein